MPDIWTDAAIGETRQVIVDNGKPIALRVNRWSDEGRRARWGEVRIGRVRKLDRPRRGAFIDLGLIEDGFVRVDSQGRAKMGGSPISLVEGQAIEVRVSREAARGKGPVLEVTALPGAGASIGRVAGPEDADGATVGPAPKDVRETIDAAIESALARDVPLVGGGAIRIEPTAALVAIDVDAGARAGPADSERFALELNLAAADGAMRQLRLRNLGGLIAIDFVAMRSPQSKELLMTRLRAQAKGDPWGVIVAPLSRFGLAEMSRGQLCTPLAETMLDDAGKLSVETVALRLLREIEREAAAGKGRPVRALAAPDVVEWLEADRIAWRSALRNRIGPNWSLATAPHISRETTMVEFQ